MNLMDYLPLLYKINSSRASIKPRKIIFFIRLHEDLVVRSQTYIEINIQYFTRIGFQIDFHILYNTRARYIHYI